MSDANFISPQHLSASWVKIALVAAHDRPFPFSAESTTRKCDASLPISQQRASTPQPAAILRSALQRRHKQTASYHDSHNMPPPSHVTCAVSPPLTQPAQPQEAIPEIIHYFRTSWSKSTKNKPPPIRQHCITTTAIARHCASPDDRAMHAFPAMGKVVQNGNFGVPTLS